MPLTRQFTIGREADWSLIPEHMRTGVDEYILRGYSVGHFLEAIFSNDLREACARADDINIGAIVNYVKFLYMYAPSDCWGSPARFEHWRKCGGIAGLAAQAVANAERDLNDAGA